MPVKKTPARKAAPNTSQITDLELIRNLAGILNDTGLSEIELDQRGVRVRVSRASSGAILQAPVVHAAAPAPVPTMPHAPAVESKPSAAESEHAGTVKSPMVGTAYLAPSPGAARFIEIGQQVKAGQTLLIIEAMKTMNQIHSPAAGKIVSIHIDNGDPVEFGAPLVTIE